MSETLCANPECRREIPKKHFLCRPCAVARGRDRHPYAEPCPDYRRDRHFPIVRTCTECGYDSAEHPGGGRARLAKVVS